MAAVASLGVVLAVWHFQQEQQQSVEEEKKKRNARGELPKWSGSSSSSSNNAIRSNHTTSSSSSSSLSPRSSNHDDTRTIIGSRIIPEEESSIPVTPPLSLHGEELDNSKTPVISNTTLSTLLEGSETIRALPKVSTNNNSEQETVQRIVDTTRTNTTTNTKISAPAAPTIPPASPPLQQPRLATLAPFDLHQALADSQRKIETTAKSIRPFCGDGVHRRRHHHHESPHHKLRLQACTSPEEAQGYRSRFTLQLVFDQPTSTSSIITTTTQSSPTQSSSLSSSPLLKYAIRQNGQPVLLPGNGDVYHVALPALQDLMQTLLQELNQRPQQYSLLLLPNLTSISFASSWDPSRTRLVTLHYNNDDGGGGGDHDESSSSSSLQGVFGKDSHPEQDAESALELSSSPSSIWIAQAEQLRKACGATLISGRVKRRVLRTPVPQQQQQQQQHVVRIAATGTDDDDNKENNSERQWIESEIGTEDELLLQGHSGWKVSSLPATNNNTSSSLTTRSPRDDPEITKKDHRHDDDDYVDGQVVRLFKPEGAFCHANAHVMYRALSWILSRLSCIRLRHGFDSHVRLLELYCGCGAHTIPIAKTGLVSQIVAIEWDERLVLACQRNLIQNQLLLYQQQEPQQEQPQDDDDNNNINTMVRVLAQDAAKWASSTLRQQEQEQFDVLLVDPPRQGLDESVTALALNPNSEIQDILYISCGKEALLRDLTVLTKEQFGIVDCTLLDLFPGTDSVESLMHLRRL